MRVLQALPLQPSIFKLMLKAGQSREGGTAGDHHGGALKGESCPGRGWLVLEEGSFEATDLQLRSLDGALARGEGASRAGAGWKKADGLCKHVREKMIAEARG